MNRFFTIFLILIFCNHGWSNDLKLDFSIERGFITGPIQVEITANHPDATIYISTNWGNEWLYNEFINIAQVYSGPIQISTSTQVRAIAVLGNEHSEVESHTYIDISNYNADQQAKLYQYPIFETSSNSLGTRYVDAKTIVEFFWPNNERKGYCSPAGIRNRQGGQGQNGDFRLYFREQYGKSRLKYELFPDEPSGSQSPEEYDKVNFHGGSQDGFGFSWNYNGCSPGAGTMMRDRFFQRLQLEANGDGIRGQYYLMFKRGVLIGVKNAEDVGHQGFMTASFGGEEDEYSLWTYYSNDMLPGNAYNAANSKEDFYDMMDVPNFIDYILVQWFSGNTDWGEASSVNNNVVVGGKLNGPYYHWTWDSHATDPGCSANWNRYVKNTYIPRNDIDFRMDFADRVLLHFFNDGTLTQQRTLDAWDYIADELQPAVSLVYNENSWQSAEQSMRNRVSGTSSSLLNWLTNNGYYPNLNPVDFSINGGEVPVGTLLSLTGNGDIYYTLDGTDPRQAGGAVANSAQLYNNGITLPEGTVQVLARVKSGSTWSAAQPVIFQVGNNPGLIINEIHFNPTPNNGIDGDEYEFIELANFGTTAINLEYFRLEGGVRFKFDYNRSPIIQPGEFVVLASNKTVFEQQHGFEPDGVFLGKLSNNSEKIKLVDTHLKEINSVKYDENWALCSDQGYSLSFQPNGTDNSDPNQWKASADLHGTPKAANVLSANVPLDLVINEIHYNPVDSIFLNPVTNMMDTVNGKNFEFIELKNIGNSPINLSGISINKGIDLRVKEDLMIPPNGFAVFAEDSIWFHIKYGFAADGIFEGQLDDSGEKINLIGCEGYYIDTLKYNDKNPWDEAPDSSYYSLELLHASLDNSNGLNWFRSDNPWGTPKAENSRVCEQAGTNIIINEINYNSNNDVLDPGNWVELHNPNANAVDLSGWTFYDNGGSFVIPQGTTLPAEGYIILVESQADFSSAFPNINQSKIVGEFSFGLSKKGERISLFDQNKCLVDYVIYNDKAPWPEAPDGDGPTLSLLEPSLDNALPESWESSFEMNESFVHGSPGVSNICVPGQPCDDGDACTTDDTFDADCNCVGILMPEDADNDGVCDLADICPNFDDNLIGTPCDDGDICTEGETYDENCGCSGGVVNDIDNDGLCDPLDACDNNLTGTPCDDGDICTLGETYDINCNCTGGVFQDADNDGICDAEDICPNLENNLLGQLCDDENPLTEFDTYNTNTCSCSGIIASASICVQVSSSEDDAEQQVDNGVVTLTSGDLDMVNDEGVVFIAAVRFQNIDIPQGATITNATIQFAADEVNTDPTNLTIKAEAIDHAPVFEATVNNISNRSLTASSVIWNPDPWNTIGENIEPQKTIDLSPIIQEIIDRPGFVQGNAIALVIEGSGIRTAESFDGSETLAPELCITYSTGQCVENYPCDDGNPVTINDQYNSECECVGEDITLSTKILLEGFYDAQNNNMHTLLYEKNLIPLSQPYNVAPWNYQGEESVSSIPEGVVDWILLITRDQDGNVLDQAAGFLTQSGEIMSIDGTPGIPINDGIGNQFSIHHRSHLAVLSSSNYDGGMYDFTLSENQAEGNGQLKLVDGKYMLYAGDYDGKGIINNIDFNDWKIQGAIINQYLSIDGDGNGIINSLDYNLWTNNKSKVGHPTIRW